MTALARVSYSHSSKHGAIVAHRIPQIHGIDLIVGGEKKFGNKFELNWFRTRFTMFAICSYVNITIYTYILEISSLSTIYIHK